ncbi:hypothetical protein Tco_1015171 [Tanacetum coccineum]|uniref:Uncharacterized protein n=1 Tax=Tanacetum coccineum TaxID=301880 RepID=A0ABQ5FK69_9ASTR
MLVWILGPKSVKRASVLHQPNGVGSQRHHIVPIEDLNGVLIALVARYGTNAFFKSSPDTELVLYPLQNKLTSGDKSLDLSAFKLSRLFFGLLSLGSSSCWRSYGAQ